MSGQQAGGDDGLTQHERPRRAPAIGEQPGEERHHDRADVVRRQERAGLGQRQVEVRANDRGDGGDAERPDVGDRLREDDDGKDQPALPRRIRGRSGAHET
jgi:hypothetical protein